MAKVTILRPSTNHTTVLQGKKKDLLNYLSDVAHSIGPMVSRGMLHDKDAVRLALPPTIKDLSDSGSGNAMLWYSEELPSLKAERRRLAKKLARQQAKKAGITVHTSR